VRQRLKDLALAVAVTLVIVVASQAQPPQVPTETRLDQCNAERGQLITQSATLNFQLREATSTLLSLGYEIHDGRWGKKKDEPKKDEKK
jgi:hypothetical protein